MGERILVVDDDRDICRYVEVNLGLEGYEVHTEHDGAGAVQAALELQPDLILLDVMMPGLDGYEACKRLRHDPRTTNASIIMLTAKSLSADKVLGLTAGADDYIAKPFDPPELIARVASALRRSRQMREVSPLTGLPGNFQITFELDRLLTKQGAQFAVIYADLDNFKAFNDHYGFLRGDEAIKATARLLSAAMTRHRNEPSFCGHVGGDDFVLIVHADVAEALAEDIVMSFDEVVRDLYDAEDLGRGHVEVADRQGTLHRYPLMSISLGVATTARRHIGSQWEASAIATEMKMLAKRKTGSAFEIDRRRGV